MKGKVILFGPYPPPYGGVAVYVSNLLKLLPQNGFVCELKDYRPFDRTSVQPGFLSLCRHFGGVNKKDCCLDSYLFLVESSIRASIGWLLVKTVKRFKWIKIIHDSTLPARYDSLLLREKFFFKLLIEFIDEFIVISDELRQWLQSRIKVKQKVTVVKSLLPLPEGDFNAFPPVELEKVRIRHKKIVSSIGVFTSNYGFKQIADAVEKIRHNSGIDIGLVLLDGAFARDEKYKSDIVKQRDWITVLTNISHPQALQVLKASDVFVRGLMQESYGLSRVESLWCATPVVATKVGETRGMLLYDFGDEEMLIQRIEEALFNPSLEEIHRWAEHFQKEAEENLRSLLKVLDPVQ